MTEFLESALHEEFNTLTQNTGIHEKLSKPLTSVHGMNVSARDMCLKNDLCEKRAEKEALMKELEKVEERVRVLEREREEKSVVLQDLLNSKRVLECVDECERVMLF